MHHKFTVDLIDSAVRSLPVIALCSGVHATSLQVNHYSVSVQLGRGKKIVTYGVEVRYRDLAQYYATRTNLLRVIHLW
jgi:hypothetical protein